MSSTTLLLSAFFLALLSYGHSKTLGKHARSDFSNTCNTIAAAVSGASQVFFPPSPEYSFDISHASISSTQVSACSVEPGSAEDVGKIVRFTYLGSSRTPFGVKGGGCTTNPGFSSTKGVEISMSRFNETKVDSTSGTVEIGAGLTWDKVYVALESTGVNVVGGRNPGLGVSGLTLGGGYSYQSSQYGLTIDTVTGYELVLPNGTVINVTADDEDLWFGLRGGLNNFGIVTKFILKSYPQTDIWGGHIFYSDNQLDAIKQAHLKFQQANDNKAFADIALAYTTSQPASQPQILASGQVLFYDGPTPSEVFDDFLAIPSIETNVTTRSFSDLILNQQSLVSPSNLRTFYQGVSVTQYSSAVFDSFVNQTKVSLSSRLAHVRSWNMNEFSNSIFSHGSASAYPPDRSQALFPSVFSLQWINASLDDTMISALRQMSDAVRATAVTDGQNVSHAAIYPNHALFGTPLKDIYGGNVKRLRKIRENIDPKDVMGLAGGWKF
ncbi:hypothetical protein BGY98DRAFT_922663 [Russula aff. rugulosa BPL654]|nr:hypothetical protein BGY98DRAFT_922663 [Russula aff. rugulosa BPL654]